MYETRRDGTVDLFYQGFHQGGHASRYFDASEVARHPDSSDRRSEVLEAQGRTYDPR